VRISKLIRRYLIPPGVVFLRRAEVRRQMYIIGKGSVGVSSSFSVVHYLGIFILVQRTLLVKAIERPERRENVNT